MLSIAVPVYDTEELLPELLDSIAEQSLFTGLGSACFEVVVVNDASPNGKKLKKIIRPYKKLFKKQNGSIILVEHRKNLGTMEARRTCTCYATGNFICFADPDDIFPKNALKSLYEAVLKTDADIVNGKMDCFFSESKIPEDKLAVIKKQLAVIKIGALNKGKILKNFLIDSGHSSFLCGKLFKTSTVRQAYNEIPHSYCILAEDFLVYFFIALKANLYYGIEDKVYKYFLNYGITSNSKIDSIEQWEKVCSVSSVFTILLSYLQENFLGNEIHNSVEEAVKDRARFYYNRNRDYLEERVTEEIKEQAKIIMQDWWGF